VEYVPRAFYSRAAMPSLTPLRLKWSHTWPDKGADFSCRDHDGNSVGRIYKMTSSRLSSGVPGSAPQRRSISGRA